MSIIEYLGTGPNPIVVPRLNTDKPLSEGDQIETSDEIARDLEAQGLFKIVKKAPQKPEPKKPSE
jgi:hypothetical protein